MFITGNKITFTAGKREAQVTIYTKSDVILDHHDPHTIIARLPSDSESRTCSTKVTVIDNDCELLIDVCKNLLTLQSANIEKLTTGKNISYFYK